MACVNADGTLTASATSVLKALQTGGTAADVAQHVGLPLYRVRSSLRELVEAGLLSEQNGHYTLTDSGKARLN
jgi:DNA-binding IclR family transcriptional regulator